MSELVLFSGIMLVSVFVSAISQVLLKKASEKGYGSRIKEYINIRVIFAYALFGSSTLITVFALRHIPLSLASVLEATGYIYVAILSYIFLKERLKKSQIIGMILIVCGIVIYSFGF